MQKRFCFIVVWLLFIALRGYSQQVQQDEVAVKKMQQQLSDANTQSEKIRLLLALDSLLVVKELDTPAIRQAIVYADKAIAFSNQSGNLKSLAVAYLMRSHLAQIRHDYKKGISSANAAIQLSEQIKNYDWAGEGYVFVWSNNALNGMDFNERIPLLLKAYNAFKTSGNKRRQADCLVALGDLYQITEQAGLALNCLKRALDLYQDVHYENIQGLYDLLGVVYLMLGDYKSAIHNGLLAIKTVDKVGDTSLSVCTYYNRLGLSYLKLHDLVHSRKYFEKSLAIATRYNDMDGIFQLSFNISFLMISEHRAQEALRFITNTVQKYPRINKKYEAHIACCMVSIYQALKQYDKAMPYTVLVEQLLTRDTTDCYTMMQAYADLIPFYIVTGRLEKANLYTHQMHELCRRKSITGSLQECYFYQFKIDSSYGNYISAIRNYQRFTGMKDSALDKVKSQQINQLNIFFETEKKDHDIQTLKKETELQAINLKQTTLMRNIVFGGSLLLLIILVSLIYAFKSKQKTNKLLRLQQEVIRHKNESLEHLLTEKEWLVKEIHHRVKNNLHMVVGLLSSQTEFLQGEEALSAIKDSQHRIQAMSLIHQKLYQSESLSYTEMSSYIHDLTAYIKDAYSKDVKIQLDIARVEFTLSYSIPIGLILNEAITNAMKYAFPHEDKGMIKVKLQKISGNDYILSIQDNGVGLPPNFDPDKCLSLGLSLMQGLSSDLNGTFSITNHQGTLVEVTFKVDAVKEIDG